MREFRQMLLANTAWATELVEENPDFFRRQAAGQRPSVLWIGGSDSRVSPEQLTQTQPGEVFIHRNVANVVGEDDLNLMSVVQYAIEVLRVPTVVLCGHYGCGGIAAAIGGGAPSPEGGKSGGALDRWLDSVRAVAADHADEIASLAEGEARANRLVELNVRDQLVRLARTPVIQAAFARGQALELHGVVYDIRDGHLKPLIDIDAATPLDAVGRPEPVLAPS